MDTPKSDTKIFQLVVLVAVFVVSLFVANKNTTLAAASPQEERNRVQPEFMTFTPSTFRSTGAQSPRNR